MIRLALALLLLPGCFTVRYLSQAAVGQAQLIGRARPLSSAIKDPETEPYVQKLLGLVPEVKGYGETMGLEPTDNYARYTDLKRPAAVWVVQGCAPLAFEPKRWSFPIVGSLPYLGFFDEKKAWEYAKQVAAEEHLDVDVRGASAYSTLGWFKDPVLSTMLGDGADGAGWLANVVLHESVHATLYVPGQSSFNESLASFVADQLTGKWLTQRFGDGSREVKAYREAEKKSSERVKRLHRAFEELDAVYRSKASDDEKRAKKAELFAQLKADLGTKRELNNATVFGFRTYDTGGPAFSRLLMRRGGDVREFLAAVRTLDAASFPEPQTDDFSKVIDAL
jgi:predicted aminopeptidase